MQRRHFIQWSFAAAATASVGGIADPAQARTYAQFDAQVPPSMLDPEHMPREVRLRTVLPPNEIHVDPGQYALFLTLPNRKAMRFGVGVGRTNLYESGEFFVGAKRKWPSWTPTPDMIKRSPGSYARFADGMPGGPNNPLGARALYLHTRGRGDTMLRIHGTNNPDTIGYRVSNGCARLTNDHIIDLYEKVPLNTRVVLYPMLT